MDDGLIQFLVIAVFVVISMMDGAARKRRKAQSKQQSIGSPPETGRLSEVADDLDQAAESSGRMAVEDLWKEMADLARGEEEEAPPAFGIESGFDPAGTGVRSLPDPATDDPSSTRKLDSELEAWAAPQQDVPTTTRSADLQSGYLHADQAFSHQQHAHEGHVEIASPARPLPEELPHEFVRHSPEMPSMPRKELPQARKPLGVLSGVRHGARKSLRDAIILAEVLDFPVALRGSDRKLPG